LVTAPMPSMPDDEGSVAIASATGEMIDYFMYEDSFHSSFLKDDEGVSLERISAIEKTNDRGNWASASSTAGFATPGKVNSSSRTLDAINEGEIVIDPPVFSPSSGFNDFSQIQYHFDTPGFIANVRIFDYHGRIIKTLANNALLGSTGSFRWDGDLEDGTKARAGYYLVLFEVFDNLGTLKSFRKRVVIASR